MENYPLSLLMAGALAGAFSLYVLIVTTQMRRVEERAHRAIPYTNKMVVRLIIAHGLATFVAIGETLVLLDIAPIVPVLEITYVAVVAFAMTLVSFGIHIYALLFHALWNARAPYRSSTRVRERLEKRRGMKHR